MASGHLVDATNCNINSSTVKGISVRLLQVIAHKQQLTIVVGDIGNTYVNVLTKEKIYTRAGDEFGPYAGMIVIVWKALYRLQTSGKRWHAHFVDTLRNMGFKPTHYDANLWIKLVEDWESYEYICMHVDDFQIIAKNPEAIMENPEGLYNQGNWTTWILLG